MNVNAAIEDRADWPKMNAVLHQEDNEDVQIAVSSPPPRRYFVLDVHEYSVRHYRLIRVQDQVAHYEFESESVV